MLALQALKVTISLVSLQSDASFSESGALAADASSSTGPSLI